MIYKFTSFLLIIALCKVFISCQENPKQKDQNVPEIIPFELTDHNNIVIKALFNHKDTLNLMFHTAAGSLTLIEDVTRDLKSITWQQTDSVKSWGGNSSARYSARNTLRIGKTTYDSIPIWENKNSGPYTDGKFGPSLFENKIIALDFNDKKIILHSILPKDISEYEKISLSIEGDFMFINGLSIFKETEVLHKFLIHSGYGGSILYDDQFTEQYNLNEYLNIIDETELKDSYGNSLKTKQALLPQFKMADIIFEEVSVGFFQGDIANQKISIVGGELLKRFNWIIDRKNESLYIKSNKLTQKTF